MKNYTIKKQKDRELAFKLVIKELERQKSHIDEQILLFKSYSKDKTMNIETFGTDDKVFLTRTPDD